ncbi:MAG: ribosome maturation factor RimM [Lachnospiraceae bacterium]|nr:ribosome maturation factor RimM [Lachnospiraceae bacterium]
MEDRLRVGVLTSAHGVHGEANIFPTTDDVKRFKKLKKVYLDTGKELRKLEIESVKFFKNMVILKFAGIDDRNEIERYKSRDLLIDREDAVPLGKDEFFICDLIGFDVITDEGEKLGPLKDILTTGANDVYVVALPEDKELLIPSIKECILNVDIEAKRIDVHLLPGLR